jgi:hypothetical protein
MPRWRATTKRCENCRRPCIDASSQAQRLNQFSGQTLIRPPTLHSSVCTSAGDGGTYLDTIGVRQCHLYQRILDRWPMQCASWTQPDPRRRKRTTLSIWPSQLRRLGGRRTASGRARFAPRRRPTSRTVAFWRVILSRQSCRMPLLGAEDRQVCGPPWEEAATRLASRILLGAKVRSRVTLLPMPRAGFRERCTGIESEMAAGVAADIAGPRARRCRTRSTIARRRHQVTRLPARTAFREWMQQHRREWRSADLSTARTSTFQSPFTASKACIASDQ